MDDFLHNLRSGKLKQPDRSNRPYNDQQYKGGQRRNVMDRRKRDFDGKDANERLNAIKEVLETLVESQKRMAEAYEARIKVEERKANAMEILAKNICRILDPQNDNVERLFRAQPVSEASTPADAQKAARDRDEATPVAMGAPDDGVDDEPAVPSMADSEMPAVRTASASSRNSEKLSNADRDALFSIISKKRENGSSWESIARHISDQGYPTLSGKGSWRGVMVKNLFEKMAS